MQAPEGTSAKKIGYEAILRFFRSGLKDSIGCALDGHDNCRGRWNRRKVYSVNFLTLDRRAGQVPNDLDRVCGLWRGLPEKRADFRKTFC